MKSLVGAALFALLFISTSYALFVDEEHEEHRHLRTDWNSLAGGREEQNLNALPDAWIVEFRAGTKGVATKAKKLARQNRGRAGSVFEALKGFVYVGDNITSIAEDPDVLRVTRDSWVHITSTQIIPTGIKRINANKKNYMKEASASCHCDAVVAVIDTGIDFNNADLRVNRTMSVDCTGDNCVIGGNDDNGHGTHVAGTIGAVNNDQGVVGVCPGAELWAVKVLGRNGSGRMSGVIAGINYILQYASTVDVVNMSLGGSGCNSAYCDAITTAKNTGVAVAVAAGNDGQPASNFSPACCDDALTVSALADSDGTAGARGSTTCRRNKDDFLASFSNYGDKVDIAAPGDCILSTSLQNTLVRLSGTSMASPHVAGALAILASNDHNSDVTTMYKTLTDNGNYGFTDKNGDTFKEPLLDVTKLPSAKMVGTCVYQPTPAPTQPRPSQAPVPIARPAQCFPKNTMCANAPTNCCASLRCKLVKNKGLICK